jgi:SAM-dependent methyltransferase
VKETVPEKDILAAGSPLTSGRKSDFSDIYAEPDPRQYFRVLDELDYQIPQRALPVFRAVLAASRSGGRNRTVLDLCCSYGINSALLFSRGDPAQVAARYLSPAAARLSAGEMAEADRRYFAGRRGDPRVLGLDASTAAITYGTRAGLLDKGWAEDLEAASPSAELRAGIADVGLIICTGGVGYIGVPTFERLLQAVRDPADLWLVVFVLRVFDYAKVAALLKDYGLVTERLPLTFPQRRFANDGERTAAIRDVERRGLDPAGKEADGWYHADCFLTRPAAAASVPVRQLLASVSGAW